VHTNYQASENLLRKLAVHLRKGGEMRLVANSFLRYQPLIEGALGNCQIRDEAEGFRIYQAVHG
jgi:16S rRNA (guanine1207-N2)-methyltransferase